MITALGQQILRTDTAGMPLEWIDYRSAVRFHFLEQIAYVAGNPLFQIHGGINAVTRQQSVVEVHSIIATHGNHQLHDSYTPPLSNRTLFQRDDPLCLYCGPRFHHRMLSRDHVTPISQGGRNLWTNVVTACTRCNNHKAGRTPEQDGMELLGNLLDNAWKWSRSQVHLTLRAAADLEIVVEDDGPGVDETVLQSLMQRGVRQDEAAPGHGIGLSIVKSLVEELNGRIAFSRSPALGGLRVEVRLGSLAAAGAGLR